MSNFLQKYKNFLERHKLLPSFSDESVFFVIVSIVVTAVVSPELRQTALQNKEVLMSLKNIFYIGIAVTLYTTFFTYFRKQNHKWRMLLLMVTVNILVASFTIIGVLDGRGHVVSLIFPALNIVIALSMLFFWLRDLIDSEMIPTRSANISNIVYGSIIVALIVIFSQYLLRVSWQTMLSISVTYACLFNKKTLASLPQIFPERARKINTIETLALKAIDRCRLELLKPAPSDLFFSAVTHKGSEIIKIPDHEQNNFADFLHRWLFQQDRTTPYIAIAFYSNITFKHQFKKKTKKRALRSEVYPQNDEAYFFAELLKTETGPDRFEGKFTYQQRIKNDRIDLVKHTRGEEIKNT
jgi:hypothetical protein